MRTFASTSIPTLFAALGIGLLSACGGGSGGGESPEAQAPVTDAPPAIDFDYKALITQLGQNVIQPTLQGFVEQTGTLKQRIDAYCAALGSETEADALAAAQAAWKSSMNIWQQAELMQIGPVTEQRDNIYSWDVISSCLVDRGVLYFRDGLTESGDPFSFSNVTTHNKGMDALEYLLFSTNLDHSCPVTPNPLVEVRENWNALSDDARRTARCNFAMEIADNLSTDASALLDTWSNSYLQQLITAGEGSTAFETQQAALNAITDAMFYIDTFTKDKKVAEPVGILDNACGNTPCTTELESQFASQSRENIEQNLLALQKLYLGSATQEDGAVGIDDILLALGENNLATTLQTDIDNAIAAVRNLNGSLKSALEDNSESVRALHGDVKTITDKMKTDFIEKLGLELPSTAAGDND